MFSPGPGGCRGRTPCRTGRPPGTDGGRRRRPRRARLVRGARHPVHRDRRVGQGPSAPRRPCGGRSGRKPGPRRHARRRRHLPPWRPHRPQERRQCAGRRPRQGRLPHRGARGRRDRGARLRPRRPRGGRGAHDPHHARVPGPGDPRGHGGPAPLRAWPRAAAAPGPARDDRGGRLGGRPGRHGPERRRPRRSWPGTARSASASTSPDGDWPPTPRTPSPSPRPPDRRRTASPPAVPCSPRTWTRWCSRRSPPT